MRVAERLQRAQLSSKVVTSEVVRRSARNVESGQHLQALQDRMTDKSHGTRGDVISVEGLTWQGHEWVEMVRSQSVWNETKSAVLDQGAPLTFELTKAMAAKLLRARVGLPPG